MVFSKRIVLAAIAMALACAANLTAQGRVQWELVSDDLRKAVGLPKDPSNTLDGIRFVDEKTGFITTTLGGLIRTDDAGATWHLLTDDQPGRGEYFFLNKDVWFSGYPNVGEPVFSRTQDGGRNWQVSRDYGVPCFISSFSFLTPDVGWAVSARGLICATEDGGKTWSAVVEYPRRVHFFHSIFMLDNTQGWVAGKGIILATGDGSHWLPQLQDPSIDVQQIHFLDRNIGFAEISGQSLDWYTFLYSKDGGQHWARTSWNGPGITGSPTALSNRVIQRGRDIWVIAYFGQPGKTQPLRVLFHSGNGAQSFESVSTVPSFLPGTSSIVFSTHQGKPVLLVLDSAGVLARAVLPTN